MARKPRGEEKFRAPLKGTSKHTNLPSSRVLYLVMALVTVVILVGGYLFYHFPEQQMRQRIEDGLSIVAQLKVEQIVEWRAERLMDADMLVGSPFFSEGVERYLASPTDTEIRDKILARLAAIEKAYPYQDILLTDVNGKVLLSLNDSVNRLSDMTLAQLAVAIKEHQAVITDFHYPPDGDSPHLDVVAPLFPWRQDSPQAIGAVVFCIDPSQYLYPLVQSWPIPSETAETLLVERDGDQVLFLNELRHQKDTALKLRIPLSQQEVPAVMAVLGKEGVVEGRDYHGVEVLSALKHIPDSPWYMVAKIDTSEALSAWRFRAGFIIASVAGFLAAALAGIGLIWQRRQRLAYQALYQAELETQALRSHFEYLVKYANDIIILTDENYHIVEVNDRALETYGYTRQEMLGLPMAALVAPEDLPSYQSRLRKIQQEGTIVAEGIHQRKDGSTFPVEVSGRSIKIEDKTYLQEIIRDITERKQAEEKTACLNRLYTTLSKTNEAIVGIRELEELYQGICRIAVEDGGFRMGWVGLVDRDSHLVKPVASHGFENGYLAKIRISIDDVPEGRGPTGTAIREGRYVICKDWEQDPRMNPWRVEGAKRGYRSSATFPLRVGTNIIAVLNLYASEPNAFTDEEVQLLDRMAANVSLAIESIEQEKQRKRAEEMLQKSELKYRQLMEQAADGIFVADLEGNLLLVNLMAQKMLGYSEDELCKMNIVETYPPDEIEVARRRLMEMRVGETMHFERQMRRKDGTLFPVEISLRVLEEGNAHGIVRDITERKRAEESLRALSLRQKAILAAVPEIIMEVDNNKVYTWANRAGFEFFGEDVIGKEAAFYFEGEQETYNLVQPLFNGSGDVFYVESWQRRKDGQKRLLGWWCRALKDENGNVKGALSSARDITERKQTEEELRNHREHLEELVKERTRELEEKTVELEQANIHLQEVDRLKSVFLASMSHELRTPLNSIIGFTGIILQGMSGEINQEQRKQLTMAKNSANHLLSLINDVLDVSKIEAGRVELSPEEMRLDDVVKEIADAFSPEASEKGLELLAEVPTGISLCSDKRRVKQVLMNLVSNAIKFTDRGSVKISARVARDGNVVIRVIDTGIGIKKEDTDKLFQPFQQIDMSLTRSREGTGLGLHLAKRLATLLGGDISAKSRYGQGSEFTFTIPLRYKEG